MNSVESIFEPKVDKKTLQRIIKALNWVEDYECEIIGRHTAEIVGLLPPGGKKTYTDEGIQRTKMRYIDLDGEIQEEPADIVNRKKGKTQDILKPEFTGGIALSWLSNPSGDIMPIYTGKEAQRMKTKDDDYHALKNEIERINKEYRSKNSKLKKMEKGRDKLKRKLDELEEDVKEFAESNERVNNLYNKKRAQAQAEKARADMLETKLETIKDKADEYEEEIQEAIKNSRSKVREKMKAEAESKAEEDLKGREEAEERLKARSISENPEEETEGEGEE